LHGLQRRGRRPHRRELRRRRTGRRGLLGRRASPQGGTMITLPPPTRLERKLHGALQSFLHLERRFEPYFRPTLNRLLREPSADLIQFVMNLRRRDEGFKLAEERALPDEEASVDSIIEAF